TFLASFPDAQRAGAAVSGMIRQGYRPRTMELIDQHVVEHLRLTKRWPMPAGPCALLLVELDGEANGLEQQMVEAAGACESAGAQEILVATDEQRRRQIWDMRRASNPVLKEQHKYKYSEDIVVPRARIPEMLNQLDALAAKNKVAIANFGHAGDGNLHVNVLFDDEEQLKHIEHILTAVVRCALDLGGTLSGEHGIGIAKRRFMTMEQSPELLRLQRDLKKVFDPLGLMNPEKLLP
ncbi:MAG: FAD-linked oxidase C-terminal domain-containing protein, partial [Pseudomonadota bacterium]